jgi:hypothetical protein
VGASTSANGSVGTWVQVPVVSTVATTQRVPVSVTPTSLTSLALTTLDISAPSPALNATSQLVPVVTSTVATSQTDVSVPFRRQTLSAFHYTMCLTEFLMRSCHVLRQC